MWTPSRSGTGPTYEREPELASLERVYAETVIDVHWPDRPHKILESRPEGVTEGEFPEGVDHIHGTPSSSGIGQAEQPYGTTR
jgi:hypothetical protein